MSDPALEERMRKVENEQAMHRATLSHIESTLKELRTLLQTSVQLQEKQVTHSEAINRAFDAITECENRLDDLEADNNKVRGALWITNIAWMAGIAALTLFLGGG